MTNHNQLLLRTVIRIKQSWHAFRKERSCVACEWEGIGTLTLNRSIDIHLYSKRNNIDIKRKKETMGQEKRMAATGGGVSAFWLLVAVAVVWWLLSLGFSCHLSPGLGASSHCGLIWALSPSTSLPPCIHKSPTLIQLTPARSRRLTHLRHIGEETTQDVYTHNFITTEERTGNLKPPWFQNQSQ